jgi:hypothetical protein
MTRFTNADFKHRIASVMLMFWLFALSAGWANACILQDRGTHLHTSGASTNVSPGHVGAVSDLDENHAPGNAPCLKVCDDSSQGLVKWKSDVDLSDLTMLQPAAMRWPALVGALDAPLAARIEFPARADLPLRIRYSRLAL